MDVAFDGLRPDDPTGSIKVVGWGSLAQELQNRIQIGQRLILEGRLRMNTIQRDDGTKEKKAEFTLSKIHSTSQNNSTPASTPPQDASTAEIPSIANSKQIKDNSQNPVTWDSSPLIPETDDIPF
jgi:single-stranded DNA-binding protein